MMNATRYAAKQFVERIKTHFPNAEQFDIREENLLNYDQFQRAFEKHNPQCSLLFSAKEGYFAYSVMAPHLLEEEIATSIGAENAMAEIKKYLENHEAEKKKKILVVDDSDVMLQAMKRLLEDTYEVSLAKSGLAAIRSMTLDRPDLVLLDYEMPVCDGKQVLEMIRAEEELTKIPVIFLTGTVDRERIQKLIPLKPAGYLLKTAQPQELKGNIDSFFQSIG